MDNDRPFREVLREIRKERLNWNQEAFGTACGYSRSGIAAIERGAVPTKVGLQRIVQAVPEKYRAPLLGTPEAREVLGKGQTPPQETEDHSEDMIEKFMSLRRFGGVDLSGQWDAMWLTTVEGKENRNREIIRIERRWNGSWQFANEAISDDNPEGGYLWVAQVELFDNSHILGYYCARERAVLAKGSLCLELRPNGREIVGVWNGLNFDTMWASGMVAMCRSTGKTFDPEVALNRFIELRPKMPY